MIRPLFAYGTLRDAEFQRELFGRSFPMDDARVAGFAVVSTAGGYLAAIAKPGASVAGALVHLDAAAYAIADAWEDMSVYERIETRADVPGGRSCACFMYVRTGAHGPPVADGRLADRSRTEVIADIRRFRADFGVNDRS